MELKEAILKLDELEQKMYAYNAAFSAMMYDGDTVAPTESGDGRGLAMSILAGESQKLMTAPEVGELLDFLAEHTEELDEVKKRQVKELKEGYKHMTEISPEENMEQVKMRAKAGEVWRKAKNENNFELFRPYLEKLLEYAKKDAARHDSTKAPMDALLDKYEKGLSTEYLDGFFAEVRGELVPLIQKISEKEEIDDSFLHRYYPVEQQREFAYYLMDVIGLDKNVCILGEVEHPYTMGINAKDVRITTHYKEHSVEDSMFSVIHEGGHAIYYLGVREDLQYTCLFDGSSMSLHESQSRFYENMVGRSRAFVEYIYPKMQEIFKEQLSDVTSEQFYRAINKVKPSLIRTQADEVTYALHVMVRYEIEKQLFAGTLDVKDVPAKWNELYKEYLGVDVPNDEQGCLQDSHWAGGMFGYFPSYALGSAYAAQMAKEMEKEFLIQDCVREEHISDITKWLGERVHQYGALIDPKEILKIAIGEFDPKVYTEYLNKKYTEIYDL